MVRHSSTISPINFRHRFTIATSHHWPMIVCDFMAEVTYFLMKDTFNPQLPPRPTYDTRIGIVSRVMSSVNKSINPIIGVQLWTCISRTVRLHTYVQCVRVCENLDELHTLWWLKQSLLEPD